MSYLKIPRNVVLRGIVEQAAREGKNAATIIQEIEKADNFSKKHWQYLVTLLEHIEAGKEEFSIAENIRLELLDYAQKKVEATN